MSSTNQNNPTARDCHRKNVSVVAAHAEKFSQSSYIPINFGKFDNFYQSLRNSEVAMRQRQRSDWLRKHQYRGDENMIINTSTCKKNEVQHQVKETSIPEFPISDEQEELYENNLIEDEREKSSSHWTTSCDIKKDSKEIISLTEKNTDYVQERRTDMADRSEVNVQDDRNLLSPSLTLEAIDPNIDMSREANENDVLETDKELSVIQLDKYYVKEEYRMNTVPFLENSVDCVEEKHIEHLFISKDIPQDSRICTPLSTKFSDMTSHLSPIMRYHDENDLVPSPNKITPESKDHQPLMSRLEVALMNFTLEGKIDTPNNVKKYSRLNVTKTSDLSSFEDIGDIVEDLNNNSSSKLSSNQAKIHTSDSSFPSSMYAESDSVDRPHLNHSQSSYFPAKGDQQLSVSSNKSFKLTPLSKAIVFEKSSNYKRINTSNRVVPLITVTPKRKPKQVNLGSLKRRRRDTSERTLIYNGKSIEHTPNVIKCKDGLCKWVPSHFSRKGACARCWMLASESEQKSFMENGGRHLRINAVKGGCPKSCKYFSLLFTNPQSDCVCFNEEYWRLCRKCFNDLHHAGV